MGGDGVVKPKPIYVLLCGFVVILLAIATSAHAQDAVEKFYKGRDLKLSIGSTPGGGYDGYGRLVARYMTKYIPGNPNIVPVNMAGAGSNRLATYIYSVAPKDGTEFAIVFPGAILDPLIGTEHLQHDPSKLIYMGSANVEVFTCFVRSDAPVQSYMDITKTQILVASTAAGGSTRDIPALENHLLGTKFKVVAGYPGSREINLAIEQGEVQGACGLGWSSIKTQSSALLNSGKIKLLAQESNKGDPELDAKGVPLTYSFAKTDEAREIMELVFSQEIFGRPFIMPPGVPDDRVAALRKAFMDTMKDKDFLADAKTQGLDIDPISGEEVQALVKKVYAFPKDIVEKAKKAIVYEAP